MEKIEKRWLSITDAAKYMNICVGTIYNGIHSKSKKVFPIKPKRLGSRILFDRREIDAHLESL